MFGRRDRVEVAVLGLWALGWALVVAPALHAAEHAHGHSHHHGAPVGPAPHGAGSLEHHQALLVEAAAAPELVATWRPFEHLAQGAPASPHLPALFSPAQPQGP